MGGRIWRWWAKGGKVIAKDTATQPRLFDSAENPETTGKSSNFGLLFKFVFKHAFILALVAYKYSNR